VDLDRRLYRRQRRLQLGSVGHTRQLFQQLNRSPHRAAAGSITDVKFDLNGGIAGAQIGANWQNGIWVIGGEADIQWSGQKGSTLFACAIVPTAVGACFPGVTFFPPTVGSAALSFDQKLEWFGTVRARLGVTPAPTVLLYVTGGLAYGEIETSGVLNTTTILLVPVSTAFSQSNTKAGWTVGGGIEGRLSANWTGKIEYLYMDLGTVSGTVIPPGGGALGLVAANWSSRITDNIVRVGLNYKFQPYVVAKY
jgi:outer membrane immunogenic protein